MAAATQVQSQGGAVTSTGGGSAPRGRSGQPLGLGIPPSGPHRRGSFNSSSGGNRRGSSGWTQVGRNGRPVRNNYGGNGRVNGRGSGTAVPSYRSGRVIGSGNATNTSFRGAPLPKRDLFIYRVRPDTNESDIENHLIALGVTDFELTLISHVNAPYKSFKLIVNVNDKEAIMSPNVWPKGVCIKRFRERVNRDQYYNN